MFIFTILTAFIPLLYLIINTPFELYIVQFILGVFTAFTFPTFMAIFTRHIDKDKDGTEWGMYFTLRDLTIAFLAVVGGYIEIRSGFTVIIAAVSIMSLIGALLSWLIKPYIKIKVSK